MGERYGLFFEEFPADYPEKSRALLTGFALSGIQGYLFGRINGEWTPARVRRASRYVSLATEAVGDYLVRAMGGYRPHPLMMSSGKGWLLTAPGTPLEKLERELVRLKRGLFLASDGRLELEAGTVPVVLVRPGGRRLMGGPWPDPGWPRSTGPWSGISSRAGPCSGWIGRGTGCPGWSLPPC